MKLRTNKNILISIVMLTIILFNSIYVSAEDIGCWVTKAAMPTHRLELGTAAVNGKIYAIGGWYGSRVKNVEEYDPINDIWTKKSDMPTARSTFGTATANGKIYAIGGWSGTTTLKTVEEYDPVNNTWTVKADMPTIRACLCAVSVNGKIYAIGGKYGGTYMKTVEEYDPVTNIWTTKASMPTARAYLGAAVVNSKIYVIGGTNGSNLNNVEEYDPATNTWTTKAAMPTSRHTLGVTAVNGKIYAVGGWSDSSSSTKIVEEYNPITNTWTNKIDMPTLRYGLSTVGIDGKMYAIGGANAAPLQTVEEYTPPLEKPDTPTNITVIQFNNQINISWNVVPEVIGYNIKRASVSGGPYTIIASNITQTNYTDANVQNGNTYYYVISAIDANGESPNSQEGSVLVPSSSITPILTTNMSKYIPNDTIPLTLKLTGVKPTDRTNSVTFDIDYDSTTFQLAGGDVSTAIENGYIPFQTKLNLGQGTTKRISVTYLNIDNDVTLKDSEKILTINFKVRKDAAAGTKTFTLRSVNMLDSTGKVYSINSGNPISKTVQIINAAVIEGYVDIYLGEEGTGLNTAVMNSLNQGAANATLNNLKFTLKHNTTDIGTTINGSEVFITDENGNSAAVDDNNKVTGRFRIYTQDESNTILTIGGAGYLTKYQDIALTAGKLFNLNSVTAPLELYPGDVGQISAKQLALTPDGKINNVDFSAWLQLYKSNMSNTATEFDKLTADFTKDGIVDNVDFSLWLATYKKLALLEVQ